MRIKVYMSAYDVTIKEDYHLSAESPEQAKKMLLEQIAKDFDESIHDLLYKPSIIQI